jgi:hypothetical protein
MNTAVANPNDFSLSNLRSLLVPERVLMMKFMMGGMLVGGASFAALWLGLPAMTPAASFVGRAGQVLGMSSAVGFLLFLSVCSCFRIFDTEHAMDPLAHAESTRYQISNRVLTNTVEQALIFLPPFLALGFVLEGEAFRALPVLLGTWLISRVIFFVSYQVRPASRGLGMVPTLMTSCVAYLLLGQALVA